MTDNKYCSVPYVLYRLFICIVLAMAFCSCSDNTETKEKDLYLVGVTGFNYYESANSFFDFISESIKELDSDLIKKGLFSLASPDSIFKKSVRMERYNFTYRSSDPCGNPIVLSGALLLPDSKDKSVQHQIDNITLYNQYWIDANYAATLLGTPAMFRAVYNQAVICSDFEGFGVDYGKHHHPFLEYFALARQSIDCQLAAMELMDHLGIRLNPDYGTYNMGISKGAPVAMAVQKMLENSEPACVCDRIRLKSSYCATGPYDLAGLMQDYIESGESEHLWMLTMLVISTYYSYPDLFEGYELEDFFTDELNNGTIEAKGVTYSLCGWIDAGRINNIYLQKRYQELGIVDVHQVLAPCFFDQDGKLDTGNVLVSRFLKIWSDNNPSLGWSPCSPILIEHSTYDNFVVYHLSYQCYLNLLFNSGEMNGNVTEHTFDIKLLKHDRMSGYSMIRILLLEDPASQKLINRFEI